MRHIRVVSSMFGILAAASACVTAGGGSVGPDGLSPRAAARASDAAARDSAAAQSIADREGPGARVSAQIVSTASGARHVRARFHLDNDAYVVVGHVDADGILRIVFPTDPTDDGFVRGARSYETNEFLAGFNDQYRMRASDRSLFRAVSATRDSYDGGLGYVFVIASWRPLRADRFSTEGRWDSFELANEDYMRDPRPAIQEFASLLVGENREAYTVQYARYFNTMAFSSPGDMGAGLGYCSGYAPMGWAMSLPFGSIYNPYSIYSRYGEDFSYRGSNYYYSAAGDCYTSGFRSYGYPGFGGYGAYGAFGYIAAAPGLPNRPRVFDINGRHTPPTPEPVPTHRFPKAGEGTQNGAVVANGETRTSHFSPEYRQRGLITTDEPSSGAPSRAPRIEARVPGSSVERTRPTIQEMTGRSPEAGNGRMSNARARASASGDGSIGQGWTQQQQAQRQEARQQQQERQQAQSQSRSRFDPSSSDNGQRGYQRPVSTDGARAERVERSAPAPRQEQTRSAPVSAPRSEAPRSAPSSGPPASAPASTSTGKPPSM